MGAIVLESLGKAYKRYPAPRYRLWEWLSGGQYRGHERMWALRGVTLSVAPGEAVGVVGENAAGKSTLLNLLRGTVMPTEGRCTVEGRVAALDLGLGFHPELTGRENCFGAGALLGLSAREVERLLPEIEDFAEIGSALDRAIRTYSTGMRLRLAFSLATAARPNVLLIDEALAVGDAYFQHKCVMRIRRFLEEGTTLFLVSHDQAAVKTLCDRALLLEDGIVTRDGRPDAVLEYYNAVIARSTASYEIEQAEVETGGARQTRSGTKAARIDEVDLRDERRSTRAFPVGSLLRIRVRVRLFEDLPGVTVGFSIRDRLANEIFGTNTYHLGVSLGPLRRGELRRVEFRLPLNLNVGSYSLTVALHEDQSHVQGNYDWWDGAQAFQVIPGEMPPSVGVCYLPVSVDLRDEQATSARDPRDRTSSEGASSREGAG